MIPPRLASPTRIWPKLGGAPPQQDPPASVRRGARPGEPAAGVGTCSAPRVGNRPRPGSASPGAWPWATPRSSARPSLEPAEVHGLEVVLLAEPVVALEERLPVLQTQRVPLGVEELQGTLDHDESNNVFPGLREKCVL